MAYSAVISLKQTIQYLLNSPQISVVSSSREILNYAHTHLTSFQEVLRLSDDSNCNRNRLNLLEEQITQILHQLEDVLEFRAADTFLSGSSLPLKLDKELITTKIEAVKKMEKEYVKESETPVFEEEDLSANAIPSRNAPLKMIGLSDTFTDLKDHLTRIIRPDDFGFFSFVGLPGTGRSILAKRVYDDVYADGKGQSFDCGAWVKIGSTYTLKQILLSIISEISKGHQSSSSSEEEDKLSEHLYSCLEGKRYIIGLDDVNNAEILVQLRKSLPEQNNGSLVFITTSLMEVAEFDHKFFSFELPTVLDEHFAWRYILSIFFGEDFDSVSQELEEAAKKIGNNCRRLPVILARIILILQKIKKTPESWSELAAAEHDRVYVIDDEISEANDVIKYMTEQDYEIWGNYLLEPSKLIERAKDCLYPDRFFPKMGIMTIYGMAGVGKTTLMKKLFQDHSVLQSFDCQAWINAGPNYQPRKILVDIQSQMYPDVDKKDLKEDANLPADLCTQLSSKKCLIMIDDLWSQDPVQYLKNHLPNIRGELMVSTRLLKVGLFGPGDQCKKARLLNNEESWDLLREKVFVEELCPLHLETPGKKIAKNCEGLPLLILAVAEVLSKSEKKTLKYWEKVAEDKIDDVMNASNEVSKTLIPSFERLPQHLKACFLYMGAFPRKYEILKSELMKLWFAEGFLEPDQSQTVEDCASKFLNELVDSNMVIVKEKGTYLKTNKICCLHSVLWHLSCNEAMKSKFFEFLNTYSDGLKMQIHRRLCIRKSILLGFKDVLEVVRSSSTLRSLLCTGPLHHYPVPLGFRSRLLRVIDALAIRFYEFPIEVLELIHLRYLAITCNDSIPFSISKLQNLQFLIVVKQMNASIKSSVDSPYIPKEIWDMKKLKHLQITGGKLPSPDFGALLPNLSSLIDVSVQSCNERVLKRIPNLEKLGIQIELAPDDNKVSFHWMKSLSYLQKLKSLKCVVMNPELGSEVVVPPVPPRLPSSLKKLKLSGLGLPWDCMSMITKLQNLEVLKLQCYAFVGPVWEIPCFDLPAIQFLSIEVADLERFDFKMPCMLNLHSLSIKDCYNLEQLPSSLPVRLQNIQVIDSHVSTTNWAEKMKEKNWERKMKTLELHLESSWNDE